MGNGKKKFVSNGKEWQIKQAIEFLTNMERVPIFYKNVLIHTKN